MASPPFVVCEDGERFVQAGADALRANADGLAARLGALSGNPVQVKATASADGRTLYRVRIGPVAPPAGLATLLEAAETARRQGN